MGWLWMLAAVGCAPCGNGGACGVADGRYFAVEPDGWDGRTPVAAVMHIHAWNSSPDRWLNDDGVMGDFSAGGVLVLLPEGNAESWNVNESPSLRDEVAFLRSVADDASSRWPLSGLYVSGHSVGASMVHLLACRDPDRYEAFAPISGAFWDPRPTSCEPAERRLQHIHGTEDTTWPLEGRWFGNIGGQDGVFESWDFWLGQSGCDAQPVESFADGVLACERWACGDGELQLCLHGGSHASPSGWVEQTLGWFHLP